mgnify:CR=1 FL=1
MSAIETEPDAAYGTAITRKVSDMTGRDMADAQVYVALQRLEHQGLLKSVSEDALPKPSKRTRGRPRKFYELTATGKRALAAAGAYVNLDAADQQISKEIKHGGSKKAPTLTPVVG